MQPNPSAARVHSAAGGAPTLPNAKAKKSDYDGFGGAAARLIGEALQKCKADGATGAELTAAVIAGNLKLAAADKAKTRLKHAGMVILDEARRWRLTSKGAEYFASILSDTAVPPPAANGGKPPLQAVKKPSEPKTNSKPVAAAAKLAAIKPSAAKTNKAKASDAPLLRLVETPEAPAAKEKAVKAKAPTAPVERTKQPAAAKAASTPEKTAAEAPAKATVKLPVAKAAPPKPVALKPAAPAAPKQAEALESKAVETKPINTAKPVVITSDAETPKIKTAAAKKQAPAPVEMKPAVAASLKTPKQPMPLESKAVEDKPIAKSAPAGEAITAEAPRVETTSPTALAPKAAKPEPAQAKAKPTKAKPVTAKQPKAEAALAAPELPLTVAKTVEPAAPAKPVVEAKVKAPAPQKPATASQQKGEARSTDLPPTYRPSSDEPFMNAKQLQYFRERLLAMKRDAIRQGQETLKKLQNTPNETGDDVDKATIIADRSLELRTRERHRILIVKIDAALRRIDEGEYGYCEETGDEISLARLEARPTATLSIEAQERRERYSRMMNADVVA